MQQERATERRLVTCLFLDIVGSTDLVMSTAPERLKRTLDDAFARVNQIVTEHGGTVEKYIGDAVFALFGAPTSHADDPLRALRAAEACRDQLAGGPVAVRVGVETGEALIDLAAAEHERQRMAVGAPVNVAARLQSAAEPGQVVVGPTCRDAASEAAEFEPLGELSLKGIGVVPAWRLVRIRAEPAAPRTPFVGRAQEIATLVAALDRTRSGAATTVLVSAPPGQGKTRVVREFVTELQRMPVLVARCRPGAETGAMTPLRQLLSSGVEATRESVERRVAELVPDAAEARRVAGALVHTAGIATTDVLPAIPIERQDEIVNAWRRYLAALGEGGPTVVWIEDLHWAEPALVRLVDRLTFAASLPLLVIGTARPEFGGASALRPGPDRMHIDLGRLDDDAARTLAAAVAVGASGIERAEGNPLFIIELARARPGAREDLPVNLQGAIAARLDELAPVDRELLQRAAVVGETFSVHDAALLTERDVASTASTLGRLAHAAYLDSVDGRYRFHHALVRDVAYGRLPVGQRMRLHAQYAREGVHPEDVEALAHQWWEALKPPDAEWVWEGARELVRMREEAFHAHVAAGGRHADRFAHEQAVEAYSRALHLTDDALAKAEVERAIGNAYARNAHGDDAWEHRVRAIDAYRAAGADPPAGLFAETLAVPAFNWGFIKVPRPDAEILALMEEGERVARASGDVPSLTRLLVQHAYFDSRGELADEAARRVEEAGDPMPYADVLQRLGMVEFVTGRYDAAERTYGRVAELIRAGATVDELEYLIFRTTARLMLGDLDGADELADQAMRFSARTAPHLRTHGLQTKQIVLVYRGDWDAVRKLADETVRVVEANPGTPWCIRGGYAVAAGALADALAGRREGAERLLAIAEPMPAVGPARVNTVLLPSVMLGREIAVPPDPAVVRGRHRQLLDAARLHEPIALAMRERWNELGPHIERLEAVGASGSLLAVAVAAALREELAGRRREHAELRALGAHGLSELIGFRVGR
ncbi:MAG TPA: adenylate/guanylate cyclase domain-containing protein [Candidatus Limnocylindria bacterium]|nr:adenylate/guanylate cyclase domain-containing protein [Candidatus Limnocylindria bacterium]